MSSLVAQELTASSELENEGVNNSDALTVDTSTTTAGVSQETSSDYPANDMGLAVGKTLTPAGRVIFLQPWVPRDVKQFPSSVRKNRAGQRQRLLPKHLGRAIAMVSS